MVEHALKRVGVQHLQEEPAYPANHHPDHIGMDHADRAVLLEQGIARWRHRFLAALRIIEHRAHPTDKGEAEAFGKGICRHRQPI
ncbi:hypothetical protein GCM10022600_12780 [Qipengyuania pelagi]